MNQLELKSGNLYLNNELYETYFSSINSVVLIKKESLFLMMPVQQASGGLLMKIRNAQGDRVIHTVEFFQQHDVEVEREMMIDVRWNAELAALTFSIP